jgi:hypothetical protein
MEAKLKRDLLGDQRSLLVEYLRTERQQRIGWEWETRMELLEGLIQLLDWMLDRQGKTLKLTWDE